MATRRRCRGETDEYRSTLCLPLLFHSVSGCIVWAEPLLNDLEWLQHAAEAGEDSSHRQQGVRSSAGASDFV